MAPSVAFYALYRGLPPTVSSFLRDQAQLNASVAIGVDVALYRPSSRRSLTLRSFAAFAVESLRHLSWYLMETLRGHIILPLPAIVTIIFAFTPFIVRRSLARPPFNTAAELYAIGWPNSDWAPQLMGTYLRFVALDDERYGLDPFDSRYILLYRRAVIYSFLISRLFSVAKPTLYLSVYSGYLQHFIPCQQAVIRGISVLVIGCSDCLYRLDDSNVPRQFSSPNLVFNSSSDCDAEVASRGATILKNRLSGSVDKAINYMPESPFQSSDAVSFWALPGVAESLSDFRTSVFNSGMPPSHNFIVVFLHELQDWHHDGVLPPFASSYYEWLLITVRHLLQHNLPFVVKIHPTIIATPERYPQTIRALCRLKCVLNVKLPISASLTTPQLADMGMALGLTVRGTVGLELAFMRLRFLCAGFPPYGSLFPGRTETHLSSYLDRITHFNEEPNITQEESDSACFYVGYQDSISGLPSVVPTGRTILTSAPSEYARVKKHL